MKQDKPKFSLSAAAGIVLCIIFIPIIIVNILLIAGSYLHPDQMPGVFGVRPAVVLSGSMEPVIQTGDLIFLHDIDAAELKEGDVICYLSSGKAVTHRIVSITQDGGGQRRFITQGDANNTEDRLAVAPEQIQGIWQGGRIGGLGDFILFMQTTTGMICFIICPLLVFLLWDIWRRRRLDKAEAAHTAQLEAELAALKAAGETTDLSQS